MIGFTEPAGTRLGFGALVIGYYDREGRLHYAGRSAPVSMTRSSASCGGGSAIGAPRPAGRDAEGVPAKGVHWTEPRLIAAVRYSGWTTDAMLRHAVFLGLREDKSPEEVVYDVPSDGERRQPDPLPAGGEREGRAAPRRKPAPRRGEGGTRCEAAGG